MAFFVLKRLDFITTVRLFNDTLLLAFVRNFRGVDKMIWNEFGVKTREFSGVCCEGVMMAFFFISAVSSLPAETTSGLLVHGATLLDVAGTGEALRVFCDRGAFAGVSSPVTMLENWVSSFCVKRLEANASSGIIEGLKGQMPVARNPAVILVGVAALSQASVKISAYWEWDPCYGYKKAGSVRPSNAQKVQRYIRT